jgi:hypothetical protein
MESHGSGLDKIETTGCLRAVYEINLVSRKKKDVADQNPRSKALSRPTDRRWGVTHLKKARSPLREEPRAHERPFIKFWDEL